MDKSSNKVRVLYMLDAFPVVSETFVSNEIERTCNLQELLGVATFNLNKEMLSLVPAPVRKKTYEYPRYIGRSRRPFVALHWLLRSPTRFIRAWRRLPPHGPFRQYFWRSAACCIHLARLRPDIIHAHFAGVAAQCARYCGEILGVPFTVCAHGYDVFFKPPTNYPELGELAARLITISQYNRAYLIKQHDVGVDKIEVIHCGVDIEKFSRSQRRQGARSDKFKLISVGRLETVKGHRFLIAACSQLAARGLSFQLEIIGDGSLRGGLEEQVRAAGLQSHIQFSGARRPEYVRSRLEAADLFVMPSVSESMGVATMEAMAMELPVVATDVNGVPELVEHGECGLLIPPEDPTALAEAITRLYQDSHLAVCLGKRARQKVCAQFNAVVEHQKLVDLWIRCVRPKSLDAC